MSELIEEKKPREEVIVDRTETVLNLCLENFSEIETSSYQGNMALRIGDIAFVKDAP